MHNHSDSNVNMCTCTTLLQSLSRTYSNQIFPRAACPVQIRAHRHIDVYTDINNVIRPLNQQILWILIEIISFIFNKLRHQIPS